MLNASAECGVSNCGDPTCFFALQVSCYFAVILRCESTVKELYTGVFLNSHPLLLPTSHRTTLVKPHCFRKQLILSFLHRSLLLSENL